jgi:hypothetical protein
MRLGEWWVAYASGALLDFAANLVYAKPVGRHSARSGRSTTVAKSSTTRLSRTS